MAKYSKAKFTKKVSIPTDKKITYSKNNIRHGITTTYVYYTYKVEYNIVTKKTNCKKKLIGYLDDETGLLVPNDNYYAFYTNTDNTAIDDNIIKKADSKVLFYGNHVLINKIIKDLHLDDILTQVLDLNMNYIAYDLINYFVTTGSSVIKPINNFYQKNFTNSDKYVDDSLISSFFESISDTDIVAFFKHWKEFFLEEEYVAVDVTSISSYSESNRFQYGYNRDNEELPQINNILIYGIDSRLPLYYEEYDGSINDKTGFQKVLSHINSLGYSNEKMTFLMDRGFPTNANLDVIEELNIKYIACIDVHLVNVAKCIKTIGNISNDITSLVLDEDNNRFYSKVMVVPGHPNRKYVFFYSSKLRDDHVIKFNNKIKEVINKLLNGIGLSRREKTFSLLLDIAYDHEDINKIISVHENKDKINKYAETFGYFGFISNIPDITSKMCIDKYGLRVYVEVEFDEQKNDLSEFRKRTHNKDTNRGKTFITFLAMIIRSTLRQKIKKYNEKYKSFNTTEKNKFSTLKGCSPKDVLEDLQLVEITNVFGKNELFHLISKKQKTEFNLVNTSDKEVELLATQEATI